MGKSALIETIRPVLRRHHFVTRAELFGSAARGEEKPTSDVDLLVEYDETAGLFDHVHLGQDLEAVLGRSVSLVERSVLNDELLSRNLFAQAIASDRVVVYERKD